MTSPGPLWTNLLFLPWIPPLVSFGQPWAALDSPGQLWAALGSPGQLWTDLLIFTLETSLPISFGQPWAAVG